MPVYPFAEKIIAKALNCGREIPMPDDVSLKLAASSSSVDTLTVNRATVDQMPEKIAVVSAKEEVAEATPSEGKAATAASSKAETAEIVPLKEEIAVASAKEETAGAIPPEGKAAAAAPSKAETAEIVPLKADTAPTKEVASAEKEGEGKTNGIVYFDNVQIDSTVDPSHLNYTRAKGSGSLPTNIREFQREIDSVAHITVLTLTSRRSLQDRLDVFSRLVDAARIGCCGPNYDLAAGKDELAAAKQALEDVGYVIRGRWFWRYTGLLALASIFCGLPGAFLLFYGIPEGWLFTAAQLKALGLQNLTIIGDDKHYPLALCIMVSAFWIPFGCAVGIWLEFALRTDSGISSESLILLHPGRWNPGQRIALTTGISYVFAILLGFNIFVVGLASIVLNDFVTTKPYVSFLIGFITGFGLPFVRDMLYKVKPEVKSENKIEAGA